MRLDRASCSFLVFVSVALLFGATVLCGAIGGVLVTLSLARMSHGGLADVCNDRASLLAPLVLFALFAIDLTAGVAF